MNPTDPNPEPPTDLDTDYEPPCWEWDLWEANAIKRGMSKEMANLGRAVIREAGQHSWCPQLRCLCSEEVLEELLLRSPKLFAWHLFGMASFWHGIFLASFGTWHLSARSQLGSLWLSR